MNFRPLALSVFAASAVFWLVSATAPISNAAHAAGLAKALKLPAPEELSAPRSALCTAELKDLVTFLEGDEDELRYRFSSGDTYCIPFKAGDVRRLELALPDLLRRGPSASGFMRSQDADGIAMIVSLNVVPRTTVTAIIGKKRPVLMVYYNRE